ncbi:hypothetical protein MES4922_130075 [Mesorhizobium ventifaucium]|uniref:Uncharacterized protein n=1 Tax=Mesorhizobium ventifaucium TaxID=666020 RepID=A0ABM9DI98_9HYPH|nr:hypothetical protein MES4922_130075 [Mesorhizobium ventifaucium]
MPPARRSKAASAPSAGLHRRSGSRALSARRQHPGRDGAGSGPERLASTVPINRRLFADPGHHGPRVAEAISIAVKIVKRKADQVGFAVRPGPLVVERWISRNRRLMVDARPAVGLDGPAASDLHGTRYENHAAAGVRLHVGDQCGCAADPAFSISLAGFSGALVRTAELSAD